MVLECVDQDISYLKLALLCQMLPSFELQVLRNVARVHVPRLRCGIIRGTTTHPALRGLLAEPTVEAGTIDLQSS